MKKNLIYLLGATLLTLGIFVGMNKYEVYKCAPGIIVPHLDICARTATEEIYGGYFLELKKVCGSEKWDCRYYYISPFTDEILDLPDSVNENLTFMSHPHSMSPFLENLAYIATTEDKKTVHIYDLVNKQDTVVESFGSEISGLYDFEWSNEDQLSFVVLDYEPTDPGLFSKNKHFYKWNDTVDPETYSASRLFYTWQNGVWNLTLKEPVEGEEVECNPIYCELQ